MPLLDDIAAQGPTFVAQVQAQLQAIEAQIEALVKQRESLAQQLECAQSIVDDGAKLQALLTP